MVDFPFEAPALRVVQPLGTFFVTVLPARLLLQVATSDQLTATMRPDGVGYTLSGTQRELMDKRLGQIADYIDRVDSAFPNAIILAANHDAGFGLDIDEVDAMKAEADADAGIAGDDHAQSRLWGISDTGKGCYRLRIPTAEKLAAIIDGQHRLFAFAKVDQESRLDMEMICAVFLDLPKPFQAQLFATINSTQKPVDRSLTFELFGYNIEEEPETFWTPDKLAVFIARKLGTEEGSPLKGRITVAPKRDAALRALAAGAAWRVSMAVVVDGILRLISANPKRDANAMRTPSSQPRKILRTGPKDRSPLRDIFVDGNDIVIYTLVDNYLRACDTLFWTPAPHNSYVLRAVGVQALFDIMRKLAPIAIEAGNLSANYFRETLGPAADIDFSAERFQVPAGAGRTAIRKAIEERVLD